MRRCCLPLFVLTLLAAPAMVIARLRGTPVIINYRGGGADDFLARAPAHVLRMLAQGSLPTATR